MARRRSRSWRHSDSPHAEGRKRRNRSRSYEREVRTLDNRFKKHAYRATLASMGKQFRPVGFSEFRGRLHAPPNFNRRDWFSILEKANLSGMGFTFRDLRHSCATMLLRNGESIASVSKLSGTRRSARHSIITHTRYPETMPDPRMRSKSVSLNRAPATTKIENSPSAKPGSRSFAVTVCLPAVNVTSS